MKILKEFGEVTLSLAALVMMLCVAVLIIHVIITGVFVLGRFQHCDKVFEVEDRETGEITKIVDQRPVYVCNF